MTPGPRNLITDIAGLRVGNAEDATLKSGTTVLVGAAPFVASVAVMGGAPGTRETDLLEPDKMAPAVDALVLSGGSAFGLAAASIFPALMMGIFSTKVNNRGAVAGMLAGLIVTLVYIFLHKGWFFIPDTNSFTDADPLLGTVKSTSFGAIGALLNFGTAILVSKLTAEPPKHIQELVESVRVPRGAGAAVEGH